MTITSVQEAEEVLAEVFSDLTSEISIAIDMCDTPYDAAHMLAKNYDMGSVIARMLYDCITLVFNERKKN